MFCPNNRCITRFALAVVCAAATSATFGQSPSVARRGASATPKANASRPPTRLSTEARLLYRYVKLERTGESNWERVPWLVDLHEAIRQAKLENRPLVLWTTDEDPLEAC
jgi:hypothetical protein